MRDSVTYTNHLNQTVTIGDAEVLLNANTVRDYTWKYDSLYSKITNFKKDIRSFSIPVTIISDDKTDIANSMFEIFERDVLAKTPGHLSIGDYKLDGYIIGEAHSNFVYDKIIDITLTFITDEPRWKKEKNFVFRLNNSATTEDGLGFPYDYPYDFLSPRSIQNFINESFVPADFIMTVYGPVSNPGITVSGNKYKVDCEVLSNEYLTINSKQRTIYLTKANGTKVNEFANRDNSEGDIFKKIPSGTCRVAMDTDCNLDITIVEERSEPKWI